MQLTAKELIEILQEVPQDSTVYFQRIEDKYINGRNEKHLWYGKQRDLQPWEQTEGWETYDMPCDVGTCFEKERNELVSCETCEHRNQYITASRCFVSNNKVFIDGHY